MKTPLGPNSEDLAVALGTDERKSLKNIVPIATYNGGHPTHNSHGACDPKEILVSIERALTKLRNNTYGICISCGAEISLAKLDADPTTEECDDCEICGDLSTHSTPA